MRITYKIRMTILIIAFIGLYLIGFALTGRVISNTSSDYCSSDINCSTGKICCFSYGHQGTCIEPKICEDTKAVRENPERTYNYSMAIGIPMFVIAGIILYLLYLYDRKHLPRNSRRKSVASKKKRSRR